MVMDIPLKRSFLPVFYGAEASISVWQICSWPHLLFLLPTEPSDDRTYHSAGARGGTEAAGTRRQPKVKGFASSKAFAAIASIEVHACLHSHPSTGRGDKQDLSIQPMSDSTRFTPNELDKLAWRSSGRWDADLPVYPHRHRRAARICGEELR